MIDAPIGSPRRPLTLNEVEHPMTSQTTPSWHEGRTTGPHPVGNHPEVDVEHAIGLADAALGAAGHEVTDQDTRELGRQIAAGAITGDEAAARLVAKLRSKPSDRSS